VLISCRDGGPVFVMKRLLLSLCLVGVVFTGHTRDVLETTQVPPASKDQLVEARAVSSLSSPAMPDSIAQYPSSGIEQVAVRSPAMTPEDTQSNALPGDAIERGWLSLVSRPYSPCLLLALFGHPTHTDECPLSGVKRT
jgi:hypothetical protein